MTQLLLVSLTAFTLFMAKPVYANIEIVFIESAPKDRFVIKNTGKCVLQNILVKIDLSQSSGSLIFDTTATGAGVEVFQPFEVTAGAIELISSAVVEDGDTHLTINIETLQPGKGASFTIDVDDTLPVSELGKTRIAGSEISGGLVKVRLEDQKPIIALFDTDSKAKVSLTLCP
ncbi:MAG: hypothetical protein QNJ56_00335 [Gammaproteobacteria bacterium]|nr:hypothetical protein [Gammaproteobacteria bacterium]